MKARAKYEEYMDVTVPDGLEDFLCTGGACEHNCCAPGWGIFINRLTYEKYAAIAIKDENFQRMLAQGTELTDTPQDAKKYARFKCMEPNNEINGNRSGCLFQTPDGWCFIQKNFGAEYLTDICIHYPRSGITRIGKETMVTSMSPSCIEIVRKYVMSPNPLRLKNIQVSNDPKKNYQICTGEVSTIKSSVMGEDEIMYVHSACIEMVYDRSISLPDRIGAIASLVKVLSENLGKPGYDATDTARSHKQNMSHFDGFLEQLPSHDQKSILCRKSKTAIAMVLCRYTKVQNVRQDFLDKITGVSANDTETDEIAQAKKICDKAEAFEKEHWDGFAVKHARVLENFLAYSLQFRMYPFNHNADDSKGADINFERNLFEFTALYNVMKFMLCLCADNDGDISDEKIINTVIYVSRMFFHGIYFTSLTDAYKSLGIYGMQYIPYTLQ
ncbi:hypothetical protein FACS1894120_1770 [Clostridia bacterium]|nr:hypothetical protein FACS1894120_1770 [Clostridia bacterium]